MESVFDHSASTYDTSFTRTHTAKMQRNKVWKYLSKILPEKSTWDVLEINCGTGEDAIYLAKAGHRVLATDLSSEMVRIARAKSDEVKLKHPIDFEVAAIEDIQEMTEGKTFDLIFSNFGGLNCLPPEEIRNFIQKLPDLLHPSGRFIAVLMPRFCLQETVYFTLKGKFTNTFRRWRRNSLPVNVGGHLQDTWYYSPSCIRELLSAPLELKSIKPVGFFLPPSYLDPYVHPKKVLMSSLNGLESVIENWSLLAGSSDHFLIDIQRA